MPRSNNHRVIYTWLSTTKCIQKRKYYNFEEMYQAFQNETNKTDINSKIFKVHMNKCAENYKNLNLYRRNTKERYMYRYIMLSDNERPDNITRISDRRKPISPVKNQNQTLIL